MPGFDALCFGGLSTAASHQHKQAFELCAQIPLPESPPWWELFKVAKADMCAVAREVNALYQMPKVTYISVYRGKHQSPKGTGIPKDSTPMVRA